MMVVEMAGQAFAIDLGFDDAAAIERPTLQDVVRTNTGVHAELKPQNLPTLNFLNANVAITAIGHRDEKVRPQWIQVFAKVFCVPCNLIIIWPTTRPE